MVNLIRQNWNCHSIWLYRLIRQPRTDGIHCGSLNSGKHGHWSVLIYSMLFLEMLTNSPFALFQFSLGLSYALSIVSIISYFFCCCFYLATICDHFEILLRFVASDAKKLRHTNDSVICQSMHQQFMQKLQNAIEIHGKIFE